MTARQLLDIAADYAELRVTITANPGMFTDEEAETALSALAEKFEAGLRRFAA